MEGSKVMAMALCALLVLTSCAGSVQATCSPDQLKGCMSAVTGGTYPSVQCCDQLAAVTDFNCFCRMMLSNPNIPQMFIKNAVQVPTKCGVKGRNLRNRQCGTVHIP